MSKHSILAELTTSASLNRCGHCKSLAPKYEASASSLSPLIPFYAIDCDAGPNKPLCGEYGIKGFPTIKAFPRGSKGAAKDYNGPRETGDMVDYAKSLVPDRVMKLRIEGDGKGSGVDKVLQKFLDEASQVIVFIYFSLKGSGAFDLGEMAGLRSDSNHSRYHPFNSEDMTSVAK